MNRLTSIPLVGPLMTTRNIFQIVVWGILLLGATLVLKNKLQHHITWMHPDEVHTINLGIDGLYGKEVYMLRVGEGNRWMAKLTYPLAVYYMNGKMGGEHFITGWDYAGGFYVKQHFHATEDIKADPNLQDLVFAMRFLLGFLVLVSFLLAAILLSRKYGWAAGVAYYAFALSTSLVGDMMLIFYSESTLVILFNLLVSLLLIDKIGQWRLYIWSAFLLAFSISVKLNGLMLLPFVLYLVYKHDTKCLSGLRIEGFGLLTLIFLYLIHINVPDLANLLDQTFANVYHYKTGHLVTTPSGLFQVKLMLKELMPWSLIFPLACAFLIYRKKAQEPFLLLTVLVTLLFILPLIGANVFISRNLVVPVIGMVLISAIALNEVIHLIAFEKKEYALVAVLLVFFGVTQLGSYESINEKVLSEKVPEIEQAGLVDVSGEFFPNSTAVSSMPDQFTLRDEIEKFKAQFDGFNYVVVNRIKQNKHYTNYILPQDFDLIHRMGNLFVFKRRGVKQPNAAVLEMIKGKTPVNVRGDLQLYILEKDLVIYSENCTDNLTQETFFFHIHPKEVGDLPLELQQHGYQNLDFQYPESAKFSNVCCLRLPLPEYPIKNVLIGQYSGDKRIWEHNINFK